MSQLAPTLKPHPITTFSSTQTIYIISNFLSPEECTTIISDHKNLIASNVTPGTVRTREQFEDVELSERVWERMKGFFEGTEGMVKDDDGETWKVDGLNTVWRLCLYEKGGKFSPHVDGRRLCGLNEQSFMTINIYPNDVPGCHKGATRFLSGPPTPYSTSPITESQVIFRAQPVIGSAAIFRDDVWHDGEELLDGTKYLLRTDVMFVRETGFDEVRLWGNLEDEERARKWLGLAEGLEDAGKSEEAVGWYRKAFRLHPGLERG